MAIFGILMPAPQPRVTETIKEKFPNDHYVLSETIWLVSGVGTVTDISAKIGIYDQKEPHKPPTGTAMVVAVTSYFGRAPQTAWDWLKVKLETPPGG
jgi:hypothetical protein